MRPHLEEIRMTTAPSRPYYELLGIEPVEAGEGRAVVALAESPHIANSHGAVHGGAVFSLLDAACAAAARSALPPGSSAMSINLNITYLEQGHGRLTGTGRVLRSGRTVIAAEAEAHDARGTLVAKASGTMRVRLAGRTAD
jgi:uncharacterized protein (TIGR00369 family)